jgi:hypothetical protein
VKSVRFIVQLCLKHPLILSAEKASIDEIFIDFTKAVREILLQRYPYLAQVPAEALAGVDTPLPPPPPISWDDLGNLIPFDPQSPESLDVRKEEGASSAQQDEEDTALEDLKATLHWVLNLNQPPRSHPDLARCGPVYSC